MRAPIHAEERLLFGLLAGGATWALWKYGLAASANVALQAGFVGSVVGGLLGGYLLQLLLALVVLGDDTSEASRRILEDRDEYYP